MRHCLVLALMQLCFMCETYAVYETLSLLGRRFAHLGRRVHCGVWRGLVWVPRMEMGVVGVMVGIVSLRMVMCALAVALIVVVVSVVLVGMGRALQVLVLVRVGVHVMMTALVLP